MSGQQDQLAPWSYFCQLLPLSYTHWPIPSIHFAALQGRASKTRRQKRRGKSSGSYLEGILWGKLCIVVRCDELQAEPAQDMNEGWSCHRHVPNGMRSASCTSHGIDVLGAYRYLAGLSALQFCSIQSNGNPTSCPKIDPNIPLLASSHFQDPVHTRNPKC